MILEYEIPKWDGDLGQPNVYLLPSRTVDGAQDQAASRAFRLAAVEGLVRCRDVFMGLARLRGMECRAPEVSRKHSMPESLRCNDGLAMSKPSERQETCTGHRRRERNAAFK